MPMVAGRDVAPELVLEERRVEVLQEVDSLL